MIKVQEYLDLAGRNQYRIWFDGLDVQAAAKVTVALERLSLGHKSSLEPVGEGVSEYKIDYGPGYRIYFGKDGEELVILLGGGTKKRQSQDVDDAKVAWREYKRRKKEAADMAAAKEKSDTKARKGKQKKER